MALFGSDFLKKIEYLSLVSRRIFRGSLMAQRRTKQLGGGIEFADHRDYSPGDDFRYLDWNLYARHDELLLKRFQEEEDLHVYFLLDCSRSMAFGSPPSSTSPARSPPRWPTWPWRTSTARGSWRSPATSRRLPDDPGQGPHPLAPQVPRKPPPKGEVTDLARVCKGFVHRSQRKGWS